MSKKNVISIQKKMEDIISKWWFTLIIVILFFIPSFTSKAFDSREAVNLVIEVLSNAVIYSVPWIFPVFKILPLILILLIIVYKNKINRLFSAYVAFNFLIVSIFENMAFTETYGFAILIGNLIVSLLVTISWLWEAISNQNKITEIKMSFSKYFIIILALFAYWYPIDMSTLSPDFNPLYLLTSESGVTFCMIVPIYLSVLILFYSKLNYITLKITSLVGFITGILNVLQFFILHPALWWMGVIHLTQLFIAFYGLLLARKVRRQDAIVD